MATTPGLQKDLSNDQNKENIVNPAGSTAMAQAPATGHDLRSPVRSPRRMRDIHLDGNVDDMQNVDPYLLDDRDLDIRSDVGGVTGSVSSLVSARSSLKSANISRRNKVKSAGTPLPRSNAGSRARELKDHEGSPFLSIDMKQENTFSPELINGKISRSTLRGSHHSSLLSVSTTGLTSNSVRSSTERIPSAQNQRPRLFSSMSLVLPSRRVQQANPNVKMPFKHSVMKPDMTVTSCNPSIAMKDRTARATHSINKMLNAQKPAQTTYIQGRLLKARLKPLEPVTMSTPTIHQCRGIVSETRQYGQSESRTFQRWKSIMSGGRQVPAKNLDVRDGASTSESVHQTSEASTPEPRVDFDFDDWADELGEPIIENGPRQDLVATTPFSLPNSRCAPRHCDEEMQTTNKLEYGGLPKNGQGQNTNTDASDISHISGPDLETMNISVSMRETASPMTMAGFSGEPAMTSSIAEGFVQRETNAIASNPDDSGDISNGIGTSDAVGESIGASSVDQNAEVTSHAMSKRPHSAVYRNQESGLSRPVMKGRPNTAVDGSRKAVRFADSDDINSERKGEMDVDFFVSEGHEKLGKNGNGGSGNNGKSRNGKGKSSCRPHSLDSGFDDRDDKGDDEDDGGGGRGGVGKGRTFLTQGACGLNPQADMQQKGRTSSQASGKQSSGFGKSSKSLSSNVEVLHEKQENKGDELSKCLSATVCYVKPEEISKVKPAKQMTKPRLPSARKTSEKIKTENKNSKDLISKDGSLSSLNGKSDCGNPNEVKKTSSSNDDKETFKNNNNKVQIGSAKSPICKQESCDSGISISEKDENVSVDSHSNVESSQATDKLKHLGGLVRPTSSSAKRMKAYKNLVAKSKRGNIRPYSGSVYQDVEIQDKKMTNKIRRDTRPASAFACSDISHIKSKYGLNSRCKSASSKPAISSTVSATSSSATSGKKSPKTRNSTLTSATSSTLPETDVENVSDKSSEKDQNYLIISQSDISSHVSNSLRSRSATKVKFADKDEYEDDRASRKSTLTSAKSYSHTSSILRGSSSSLDAAENSRNKKGDDFDEIDDVDYDQMWAELPDDSSDVEKSGNEDNDDDEIDDYFMSKFDILQKQFNTVTAELAAERSKLQENSVLPPESALVISNDETKSVEGDEDDPYYVSEEEMEFIRTSGYSLESGTQIFVTDSSMFDDAQTILANEDESTIESEQRQTKSPESFPFLEYEEPEWRKNAWISGDLYKKTNRYVEIKVQDSITHGEKVKKDKRSSVSSRIDHGQKKYRGNKDKRGNSDNATFDDNNDENTNSTYRKSVYKMDTERSQPIHITIPCMDYLPFMCEGTAKPQRERSSRAATPIAARKLKSNKCHSARSDDGNTGRNEKELIIKSSLNISTTSENNQRKNSNDSTENLEKSVDDNIDMHTASRSSLGSKESDLNRPESRNNYYDLLLAYRSHCMEDSDDDDDDDDDDDNDINHYNEVIKEDTACQCVIESGNKELKDDVENVNHEGSDSVSRQEVDNVTQNEVTGEEVTNALQHAKVNSLNARPISAGTNDSGLETDCSADEGGRGIDPNIDQSNDSKRGNNQSRWRPDSGISLDGSETTDKDLAEDKHGQSTILEVVASAKNLTKPRPATHQPSSEDMEKLSKFPPLCFKLNAKPPAGFLYYFAYGPNMNADRISCYLGCETPPPRFWGLLFGFGLVFNMKGTSNPEQVGGLPNLEWNPQTSVEGCIYQITPAQLERLDKFVGYPKSMEHVVLPVWMSNSLDPDAMGVAQYCVPALTFIAKDKYTWTEPVPPSDYAISQCVKSADLVTPEFKGHLSSLFSTVQQHSSHNQLALVASA